MAQVNKKTVQLSEVIEFIGKPDDRGKHLSRRLCWVDIARLDDIPCTLEATGGRHATAKHARYWPCLLYPGGHTEVFSEINKGQ